MGREGRGREGRSKGRGERGRGGEWEDPLDPPPEKLSSYAIVTQFDSVAPDGRSECSEPNRTL